MLTILLSLVQHAGLALEVGCGNGHLTYQLAPHFHGYYAIDRSKARIREAEDNKPRHLDNLTFIHSKLENFNVTRKVNTVFMIRSFHFMECSALDVVSQKLTNEGVSVVVEPAHLPHGWGDSRLNSLSHDFCLKSWQRKLDLLKASHDCLMCRGYRHIRYETLNVYVYQKQKM